MEKNESTTSNIACKQLIKQENQECSYFCGVNWSKNLSQITNPIQGQGVYIFFSETVPTLTKSRRAMCSLITLPLPFQIFSFLYKRYTNTPGGQS